MRFFSNPYLARRFSVSVFLAIPLSFGVMSIACAQTEPPPISQTYDIRFTTTTKHLYIKRSPTNCSHRTSYRRIATSSCWPSTT